MKSHDLITAYLKQINNEANKAADKSNVVVDDNSRRSYCYGYFESAIRCTLLDLNLTEEQQNILMTRLIKSINN